MTISEPIHQVERAVGESTAPAVTANRRRRGATSTTA